MHLGKLYCPVMKVVPSKLLQKAVCTELAISKADLHVLGCSHGFEMIQMLAPLHRSWRIWAFL